MGLNFFGQSVCQRKTPDVYRESTNMRTVFILFVFIIAVPISPAHGQNSAETRATLADLPGVAIHVARLAVDIESLGITSGVLRVEVERRLKASGLTVLHPDVQEPVPGDPTLYLDVTAVIEDPPDQISYAIRLELTQTVRLDRDASFQIFHVATWSVGGVAVYAKGWRRAIIEDVVGYTDEFVSAYFAANPTLTD